MSFSREIMDQIREFAKEQSQHYLEEAEMTYMEQLRRKTGQTKAKIMEQLAKFKSRSNTALEAENDMILYMSDYMKDLVARGYTEQEALERAKQELKFRSETPKSTHLQERFAKYYENRDPAEYEAIGLFYAGFLFCGVAIGATIGFLSSGGREALLSGGWIDTVIGTGIGGIIGIGLGLLTNAIIVLRNKR